jgi:lysozyme
MQPRHRVSRTAIDLIKRFEGYRRAAAQLPDGRWTIGHGHTLTARQGAEVSEDDAEALLLYDLIGVAHALNEAAYSTLTQNQFDALASFVFNVGLDNFHQSSVLKRLNEGALIQAACAMELWRKANVGGERIVVDALVRRRSVEKTLFLTPPGGAWVPAPTPILRPLLDTDARDIVPSEEPADVTTALDGDRLVVLREGEPAPAPVRPDDEAQGPAKAAAEAVSARLSTIFQESFEEPEAAREGHAVEPPTHPEHIPDDPHPQADFGPPLTPPPMEEPVPFFLRAPDPEAEPAQLDETRFDDDEEDGPDNADLFHGGPGGDVVEDERSVSDSSDDLDDGYQQDRRIIDDSAPYDFVAPVVRPLPERPEGGLLTLVALAVLGLVFFGGGIFWAMYARSAAEPHLLGPRMVGGLAGIAGIGFFVVAVYLLLERLSRAAERQARHRP